MRARIDEIYKCISMRLQLPIALYSALGNAWAHANCMRWRIQIVFLGMNWHTQFTSYDNQAQVFIALSQNQPPLARSSQMAAQPKSLLRGATPRGTQKPWQLPKEAAPRPLWRWGRTCKRPCEEKRFAGGYASAAGTKVGLEGADLNAYQNTSPTGLHA